jgi:hypothetical protein
MKRNEGAVPVIATMLLLIIVSATVLVVYSYVSGSTVLPDSDQQTGRMLEKLKTVEVKGYADGHYSIFIMNTGAVDSVIDTFYVKNFTGNTLVAIPVNAPLAVGETKEFVFDPYLVGQEPWSWYEILGVTDRGNKIPTNLYGFYTGAYEIGEWPENGEKDQKFDVFDVTINSTSTNPSNLANLTAIDGNYFGYLANNWSNAITTYATGVFDFDLNATYNAHSENIADLSNWGSSTVLHFNVHPYSGNYFLSSFFNGTSTILRYPTIAVTLVFDLEGSGWSTLNGSIQFFDWSRNEYATSGNGYFEFVDGTTLPTASHPPASSGYKNITVIADAANLLGDHGEWSIKLNMSNTDNNNLKLDYFAVTEMTENAAPFNTIFWYNVAGIDKNNVTQILFSTTGIFPTSGVSYEFLVYNFDNNTWDVLGEFQGSYSMQTCVYKALWPCSSYISPTNIINTRIIPLHDLPSQDMVYIDQARIIVRQTE